MSPDLPSAKHARLCGVAAYVASSPESRAIRISSELGLTLNEARYWLKGADKNARTKAKFLHGADPESLT